MALNPAVIQTNNQLWSTDRGWDSVGQMNVIRPKSCRELPAMVWKKSASVEAPGSLPPCDQASAAGMVERRRVMGTMESSPARMFVSEKCCDGNVNADSMQERPQCFQILTTVAPTWALRPDVVMP